MKRFVLRTVGGIYAIACLLVTFSVTDWICDVLAVIILVLIVFLGWLDYRMFKRNRLT